MSDTMEVTRAFLEQKFQELGKELLEAGPADRTLILNRMRILDEVREQYNSLCLRCQNAFMETANEATEEQLAILRTYMTFGQDGLVIGKSGNPFTFRVINDRLAFYMNNTEVAYLSNNSDKRTTNVLRRCDTHIGGNSRAGYMEMG